MNFFRKIINQTYPIRTWFSKVTGLGIEVFENENKEAAIESFYSLKAILNSGEEISFEMFRGKKVMLINVASECGFTPQYAELEKLYQQNKITVLGFPSNNFGGQEPGTNDEIAAFCKKNYGVTFPMAAKVSVKGDDMAPIYSWLTKKENNGVIDSEIEWNFNKFLLDENGVLVAKFDSKVTPLSDEVVHYLK